MSNLIYDMDSSQVDDVVAWAKANSLRPNWILADDVFVECDTIRFREIIAAPGTEGHEYPECISAPTPEDELAVRVGEWRTVPLVVHPSKFGIEVAE